MDHEDEEYTYKPSTLIMDNVLGNSDLYPMLFVVWLIDGLRNGSPAVSMLKDIFGICYTSDICNQ